MRNMRFCNIFHTQPLTGTPSRQVHPLLRRGLGRPFFPLFFFSFGLGEALFSFFKYFRPLPHLLSNIENMSTFFSVKIPLFCPFTAAAAVSVDQFITFYFLSSLFPNIFLLSFFRCLFFTNFPRSLCFSVTV